MVIVSLRCCLLVATYLLASVSSLILERDIHGLTSRTWTALSSLDLDHALHDFRHKFENPELSLVPEQDPDRIRLAVYRINGLNKHLAEKLSIPMRDIDRPYCSCMAIEMHYDEFMTQTTRLLVLLLERKPNPFTSTDDVDNDIFEVIKWMQALWASRNAKGNEQHLSFIEQMQTMYKASECFSDMKKLLRRDVEVVELLNDVMDAYDPNHAARRELLQ